MDHEMVKGYVARRQSEGGDAKTIYCELRSMGVDQDAAMSAVQSGQAPATGAPAQQNPYPAPAGLDYAANANLYRAASGVRPDPMWVKVLAIIIMVLSFVVFWGLGTILLLSVSG